MRRTDLQGETDDPDSAEQQREQGESIRDFWIKSGSSISRDHVQTDKNCILMWSGGHALHWTYCKNFRMIIGSLMVIGYYYQDNGPVSPSSQY